MANRKHSYENDYNEEEGKQDQLYYNNKKRYPYLKTIFTEDQYESERNRIKHGRMFGIDPGNRSLFEATEKAYTTEDFIRIDKKLGPVLPEPSREAIKLRQMLKKQQKNIESLICKDPKKTKERTLLYQQRALNRKLHKEALSEHSHRTFRYTKDQRRKECNAKKKEKARNGRRNKELFVQGQCACRCNCTIPFPPPLPGNSNIDLFVYITTTAHYISPIYAIYAIYPISPIYPI